MKIVLDRIVMTADGLVDIDVPGATGYLDTDYAAKGRAAVEALDQYDLVTVHIEAVPNPLPVMDEAARLGIDVGLVLNPPTPVEAIEPFLDRCSMALVMSVHPGFGGQAFLETVVPKIERLRETIDSRALAADIQVDGGITADTAAIASQAGADVFVAGSTIFGSDDPVAAVNTTDTVFVGGGNTFVLLRDLYDNGLIAPLRERVDAGMPYMGASAGTNIAGMTIGTSNDMPVVYPPTFDAHVERSKGSDS